MPHISDGDEIAILSIFSSISQRRCFVVVAVYLYLLLFIMFTYDTLCDNNIVCKILSGIEQVLHYY
jgi:hypothetical protein